MGQRGPKSGPHRETCALSLCLVTRQIASSRPRAVIPAAFDAGRYHRQYPAVPYPRTASGSKPMPSRPEHHRSWDDGAIVDTRVSPSSLHHIYIVSITLTSPELGFLRGLSICLPLGRRWWHPRAPLPGASSLLQHLPAPVCPESSAYVTQRRHQGLGNQSSSERLQPWLKGGEER